MSGCEEAKELAVRFEEDQLKPFLECAIDARNVFELLSATEIGMLT